MLVLYTIYYYLIITHTHTSHKCIHTLTHAHTYIYIHTLREILCLTRAASFSLRSLYSRIIIILITKKRGVIVYGDKGGEQWGPGRTYLT